MADWKHGVSLWLRHIRLSRIILLLLLVFIIAPLVAHHYLSKFAVESYEDTHKSRMKLDHPDDLQNVKTTDLKYHVDELKRIKASVNNELRELESKRQKLHAEIAGYNTHIDKLKGEYEKTTKFLHLLRLSVENTKLEKEDIVKNNQPALGNPVRILPQLKDETNIPGPLAWHRCRMGTCFDFSICSLSSGFPVYFYNPDIYTVTMSQVESFIKVSVTYSFDSTPYRTYDPHIACLFVVLVGDSEKRIEDRQYLEKKLQGLPYWHGDGRNHILLNMARSAANKDMFSDVNTGRAMLAQSTFLDTQFRKEFDLIIPPALGSSHGDTWDQLPPLLPARRKHLLSFQGENHLLEQIFPLEDFSPVIGKSVTMAYPSADEMLARSNRNSHASMPQKRSLLSSNADVDGAEGHNEMMQLLTVEHVLVEHLKQMQKSYSLDNFFFQFRCESERVAGLNGEWDLCGPAAKREEMLKESTFSLILSPTNYSVISTSITQIRVFEALKFGCIPVILGDSVDFPFSELLSWKRASVSLPKARISELHFFIRSITDADIVAMKWHGRIFFEKYFGTTQNIIDTLLATVRTRLQIPPSPMREEPSPSVFNHTFVPLKDEDVEPQAETEDMLGPIEPAQASPKFLRNFTISVDTFSMPGDPFHLYPFMPADPVLPSEAKFRGSGAGFRPIGRGAGGSGREFNEALGGNTPREQFTIVMLTYEREAVLINALQRLKGLPHLNKVVVVWNSPKLPSEDLKWPDIGARVHVLRTTKNSLNNRFLPYDAIETEAILSIDDDAHLRHDEIIFGFRVWRESRERIVGFPGRFHAWDLEQKTWLYNSNYSCELSMVLTGAAFFHKYYSYLYSYVMPQAIRDKVDEYINCEDLAMNFLVSHITRKPPVKVTSRWTFRCPGCPKALSVEDTHFHERHKCINFFTKVYGYNPLLYTQFRVDSVLFKTRIPHDKQKCFKFI